MYVNSRNKKYETWDTKRSPRHRAQTGSGVPGENIILQEVGILRGKPNS